MGMENWNYCRCVRFNHHADFMMWLYNKVMNWVSRNILLAPFMCLFLLFACGSSHKAVMKERKVVSTDSISESVHVVEGSHTSLSTLIATEGSYVIDFRVYDTRKPVDSLTGKRPLLADGQIKGDLRKKEETNVEIQDSMKVDADKELSSQNHEKSRSEEIKDNKESTLPEQIGWMCVGIAVLLVVVFIIKRSK